MSRYQKQGSGAALDLLKSDDYDNNLTSEVKKLALLDLGEDDVTRCRALKQLRENLRNHQTISKCRLDSNFLLRFLRMKKYNVRDAQHLLEKYLRIRKEHPQWFSDLDILDPRISDLVDRGYFFALPERDASGRRVFFSKVSCLDTSRDTSSDMMKVIQIAFESLLEDDENQVRGFTYIFEKKDVNLSMIALWSLSDVANVIQFCEKTIPMRHKEIHFVNVPTAVHAIFEFVKTLLSDKIKNRFNVHSTLNSLRESVPENILPKEYGGQVPMKEMIKLYKKELLAARENVMMLNKYELKNTKSKVIGKAFNTINRSLKRLEID